MTLVFLKGYQWPFDIRKARDGSSLIDLLVYRERVLRGRRVFLDFRSNPVRPDFDPSGLDPEAYRYLERAGVLALGPSTPVQRLQHMNRPSYDFYLERNPGVDLATEMLEIAVCAQHNNGGLAVDQWWQSNLEGFFPVGEAAGAHGVYRPGGAALNSGQVGATRAAQYIAARRTQAPIGDDVYEQAAVPVVAAAFELLDAATGRAAGAPDSTDDLLRRCTELMSSHAGMVRSPESIQAALAQVRGWLDQYADTVVVDATSRRSVDRLFLIRDILACQYVYLSAMAQYLARGGCSRGSVLYSDPEGSLPCGPDGAELGLPERFRFRLEEGLTDLIQEACWDGRQEPSLTWRPVRPIPADDDFFENVWRRYRADQNTY